ncbi:MAG: magnesium transporter [Desulfomonile tiedjei]|nr:magnesium transporter [Desulfomonile tiedjei]
MAVSDRISVAHPRHGFHSFSALLGLKVRASSRQVLGKVVDLMVDLDLPLPEVVNLVYRHRWSKERWCVAWSQVQSILPSEIVLNPDTASTHVPARESRPSSHILLKDFLLDKQIVDINGAKVERVNDLHFVRSDGKLKLVQLDVGFRGLLRRLGFEGPVVRFCEWFFDYTLKERLIAWNYAQPLADPDRLRLQIPQSKMSELHPADLADIIEDMDVNERAAVVESLKSEVLADALEEMDPKVQVSIMRGLEPEKAADIIEEMSPDEAADLIADLPAETASGIFKELDPDYEEEVKGLLAHEEDKAGGLMTTEFVALRPDETIVDALAYIKQNADEIDVIYYIYVVDEQTRLLGVINLRELLSHEIFTPLERIMTTRVISTQLDDDASHVADLFAKYGFRAIPVLDEDNRIHGVVRFKALMEILAPHLGR